MDWWGYYYRRFLRYRQRYHLLEEKMIGKSPLKEILLNILSSPMLKGLGAFLMLILTWIFGNGDHKEIYIVYTLILFDTVTGVMKGFKNKTICSSKFFRVAIKCVVYFILLATAALMDKALPISYALPIMEGFLAITEFISITENSAEIGIPVPRVIVETLRVMQREEAAVMEKPRPHRKHHKTHG